jgi:trehalose 6-phosphate synthase/phosphatase
MRLIIASNRLPFTASLENGKPRFVPSPGGLTTGLWSYLERSQADASRNLDFMWVGWPGVSVAPEQETSIRDFGESRFKASPIFLPEETMDRFYLGFCNRTLWPLFHYFTTLARFEEGYWREYQRVNQIFADALVRILKPDDLLWIHDYHLMLLPRLIREKFPDLPIGFFLHIPFPSYEVFRLLPRQWRAEILEGLLGAGLIGFHTHDYARDFLTSVLRTCGYEHHLGHLTLRNRTVKVDTFPMGIDFERFAQAAASENTQGRVTELRVKCGSQKIIFSVDRLDYTKGLINRLRGYELFLKNNPDWHGKVIFIVSVAPSRIGVRSYQAMKQELEETVGRIVGAYGNVHWTPLIYQFRNLSFEEIVPLYRLCDVALITPLRDGMNLVAKEFIASRPGQTGVLILSEMAGAAKEMGEALLVNPFHVEDFARALEQALAMPVSEQIRRNQLMQERLRRYDVNRWAEEFVQAMVSTQTIESARLARWLRGKPHDALLERYRAASHRLLFLDYDGTLIPFAATPRLARPDRELLDLLGLLCADPRNEVVIVSGRSRSDLEDFFGPLPVSMVAEHGVWLRPRGAPWKLLKSMTADWKERVRPILQLYVDRLPGALLEEKEFSLAWHYRRADPEQGSVRAKELLDDLADYTRNIDVQVLEGKRVVEVRTAGVNKGIAATEWLRDNPPEFLLGIGDDWTDEDLFQALPMNAYSVRVGVSTTAAAFFLESHTAVRDLLLELSSIRPNPVEENQPPEAQGPGPELAPLTAALR